MENRIHGNRFFGNRFFGKNFIATVKAKEDAITALPPKDMSVTKSVDRLPESVIGPGS